MSDEFSSPAAVKVDKKRRRSSISRGRISITGSSEKESSPNTPESKAILQTVRAYEKYKKQLLAEIDSWEQLKEAKEKSWDAERRRFQQPITRQECRITMQMHQLLDSMPDYAKPINRIKKYESSAMTYISYAIDGERVLSELQDISKDALRKQKQRLASDILKRQRSPYEILADLFACM